MMFKIIGEAIGNMISGRQGAMIGKKIGEVIDEAAVPIIITIITGKPNKR